MSVLCAEARIELIIVLRFVAHRLLANSTLVNNQIFVAVAWLRFLVVMTSRLTLLVALVLDGIGILDDDVSRLGCFVGLVADLLEVQLAGVESAERRLLWLLLWAVFFCWFMLLLLEDVRLDLEGFPARLVEKFFVDVALSFLCLLLVRRFLEWSVLKISLGYSVLGAAGQTLGNRDAHDISWNSWFWCSAVKWKFLRISKKNSSSFDLRLLLLGTFKVDCCTILIEVLILFRSSDGLSAIASFFLLVITAEARVAWAGRPRELKSREAVLLALKIFFKNFKF